MSTRNFDSSQLTRQIKGRAIFTNGLLKTTAINAGLITNTTWSGGGQGSDNETSIAASPGGGVYVSEAQRLAIINSVTGGGGGAPPGPPPPVVVYESLVGTAFSVPGSKTLPSGFVVPEVYTWATIVLVGGGGGGGASRSGNGPGNGAGGGGGSGALLTAKIAVTPGESITITRVGAGGIGGVYNQPPKKGGNGSATDILIGSTVYQAYGGSGGFSSDGSTPGQYGNGGTSLSPPPGAAGANGNNGTSGGTKDTRGFAAGGSGGASVFSIFGRGGASPDLSDVSGYTGGSYGMNGYYRITLYQSEPPPILLYDAVSNIIPAPFDVPTFVGLGYSRITFLLVGGGGGGGSGYFAGGGGGGGSGALVYYARSLGTLGSFTTTRGAGGSYNSDGEPTTVEIGGQITLSAGGGTKGEEVISAPGQGGAGGTYISLGLGQDGITGGTGDDAANSGEGGLGGSSIFGSSGFSPYGLGGKGGSAATDTSEVGINGYYQIVIT